MTKYYSKIRKILTDCERERKRMRLMSITMEARKTSVYAGANPLHKIKDSCCIGYVGDVSESIPKGRGKIHLRHRMMISMGGGRVIFWGELQLPIISSNR